MEVKEKALAQSTIDDKLSREFFFRALAYGFTNVCVKSAEYWIQAISLFGGGSNEGDKTTAF